MADQRSFDPTKDTSTARFRGSDGIWSGWKQNSNEDHLMGGYTPSGATQLIGLISFDIAAQMADVKKVLKSELHLFTAADHGDFRTQKTTADNIRVSALKHAWLTDTSPEGTWEGEIADTVVTDYFTTYTSYGHISDVALAEAVVDVTEVMRTFLPTSVLDDQSKPGLGRTFHGLHLNASGSGDTYKAREWVVASQHHPNTSIRPFMVMTVELKGGPGLTRLVSPDGDVAAGSDVFLEGEYEPGRPGDIIKQTQVRISDPADGDANVWTTLKSPTNTDVETSTFAVKVTTPNLVPGKAYEWTARVQNQLGEWTPWVEPKAAIRYRSTTPSLGVLRPVGSVGNLLAVKFRAIWSSASQRAAIWTVQLRTQLVSTDPTWEDDLIWDSGRVTVPANAPKPAEPWMGTAYEHVLSMRYGGPLVSPGTYSYRAQAKDRYDGETDWVYGEISVTQPYILEPGGETNLSTYGVQPPPFRIRIFGMGANRGPGTLLAELHDAANVGASEYFNAGGEFYFTIPAIHPQVSVIEPYQCHYSLEMHTAEGWRPKAYGLITDFDATEDEVVFYGMDYLAVLGRLVEERFDSTNAELPTDKGGAKYVDKTVSFVITDQLNKARTLPNSPVGFITVGDVASMPEKVTVYASFKQRLPFIAGLIDSSRAGSGRKTRLVCERDATGAFKWRVLNDPGINRDNLRLEYGGMVQGFRTVPFSGWGTAVHATGRTVLGTKVYSDRKVAPGIDETIYGAWPTTTMYADIDDLNDLRRRTAQAAAQVAKVGKLMALGIRVGSLDIKDSWDICDSVPVHIKRGVVDTTRFGSGYWTIWGWSWQSYPDGHSDTNLVLAPRQDTVAPDPDLIPSEPILDTPDFATGTGPPNSTSYPNLDNAYLALDVENGDIYEKDPITGEWVLTGNIEGPAGIEGPEGPPGPEGPVGPAGPSGGGDAIAPPVPEIKATTSGTVLNSDGTAVTNLIATIGYTTPPVGLVDLDQFILETTRFPLDSDASSPDWARATQWVSQSADVTGTLDTIVVQPSVLAATGYWLRAYAVDRSGNRQPTPSAVVAMTTSEDPFAPPAPTGIVVQAGMSTIAVRWDPIAVADLAYVEVEVSEVGAGVLMTVQVAGTLTVITGLTNDVTYAVRLRSVDLSGNTILDPTVEPPVTVKATDPDAGWVDGGTAVPTPLPGSALVWDEAMIEDLFAGNLNADWITAGTLRVGGAPGTSTAIEVYDGAGNLIGRWSDAGIEVMDPANPQYKLTVAESSLIIQDLTDPANPFTTVSVTPLGIDAASITFGSARGGHNLIPNSSFETGPFSVTNVVNSVWDVAADWNAVGSRQGADVNITTGAGALTMTTVV